MNATIETSKAEALARHRLDALISQARRVKLPMAALAAFIGALVWFSVPAPLVLGWIAAVLAMLAVRGYGLHAIQRREGPTSLREAILYSIVNGAVHGAPAWLFLPSLDLEPRAILTLILIVQSTTAISTSGFYLPAFRAYSWPILFPLALVWAVSGIEPALDPIRLGVALFIATYAFVQDGFARRSEETFIESFDIRFRNEQLVDELRRERAALAIERDRAEAASRAKSRFLAAASHDLRQPMHTMALLSATMMLAELPPNARETAENIEEAIGELSSLLDGLLDISKLDAGIVTIRREATLLEPVLERLHRDIALAARDKGISVTFSCEPGLAVTTDRQHLERILRNLLDNAVKYTDRGTITVAAGTSEGRARIRVADTGIGIADEEQERVFEEFYQIDNLERDRVRGLGLGLPIVRRLCKLLDVGLQLRSAPGKGTEVDLRIELAAREAAHVAHEAPARPSMAGVHVLLVDDESTVRESTRLFLEALGCRVEAAEGVADALRAMESEGIDIVVADYRLRGHDNGVGLIRMLRERHPRLAAILVSGDTAPERLQEANAAGVEMLHKPVRHEALCRAIETAIRKGEAS